MSLFAKSKLKWSFWFSCYLDSNCKQLKQKKQEKKRVRRRKIFIYILSLYFCVLYLAYTILQIIHDVFGSFPGGGSMQGQITFWLQSNHNGVGLELDRDSVRSSLGPSRTTFDLICTRVWSLYSHMHKQTTPRGRKLCFEMLSFKQTRLAR